VGCAVVGLVASARPARADEFRVKWVLRVPRVNTRLGPNLVRVFSFVTRWSCSGNGPRAKWVRVRVFWVTGFGLGFYAQSYVRSYVKEATVKQRRQVAACVSLKGKRRMLLASQTSLEAYTTMFWPMKSLIFL
jgi:hypothetical protein